MTVDETDRRVAAALSEGLPLEPRPYAALAAGLGLDEAEVIARARRLIEEGVISRLGVIVRHHELGYRANAMVVWDVPDTDVHVVGERLTRLPYVSLCYRRPRRPPVWPYNLFCMIHGRERLAVATLVERASQHGGIEDRPRTLLFSRRRFKQQGARYDRAPAAGEAVDG